MVEGLWYIIQDNIPSKRGDFYLIIYHSVIYDIIP